MNEPLPYWAIQALVWTVCGLLTLIGIFIAFMLKSYLNSRKEKDTEQKEFNSRQISINENLVVTVSKLQDFSKLHHKEIMALKDDVLELKYGRKTSNR